VRNRGRRCRRSIRPVDLSPTRPPHLFRLRLLSDDSYLFEGLQIADKTKTHPKAKLQNAPTYWKLKPLSCLFSFANKNKNLYLPTV